MKNLFAYGTLMCDQIMQVVSGFHLSPLPASLKGFSRRTVRGEDYPAILPNAEGCVPGVIYLDVPNVAWRRLDSYEGEMYLREHVEVELGDKYAMPAEVYVVKPAFVRQLGLNDWDYVYFLQHNKERYLKELK